MKREELKNIVAATLLEWRGIEPQDVDLDALAEAVAWRLKEADTGLQEAGHKGGNVAATLSAEEQRDLKGLLDPDSWPRWPLLPMVEKIAGPWKRRAGFVLEGRPVVYLKNVWDIPDATPLSKLIRDLEKVEYSSFEELVKVWRVD